MLSGAGATFEPEVLEVHAAGEAGGFAVLPERRLAQRQQGALERAALVAVRALDVRIERETHAHAAARGPAVAVLTLAVADADGRLVVLDACAALAGERAGFLLALGDVLLAIHATDEGVESLVELWQRQVDAKTQLGLEAFDLVPEQRGRHTAGDILVLGCTRLAAEDAIDAHRRTPQGPVEPVLYAVEPRLAQCLG